MELKYNPYSEDVRKNPWPVYERMRSEAPAYFIEELNAWALSRFDDVWRASMDYKSYTASKGTSLDALLDTRNAQPSVFLFKDPPEHSAHRNLIAPMYRRESVGLLEDKIRSQVKIHLRKDLEAGALEAHSLASRVAIHIIADFLGISEEAMIHIRSLIDDFYLREPGINGVTPNGVKAFIEVREYVLKIIEDCRKGKPSPGSHLDAWINAAVKGQKMTDEEIFFSTFAIAITGSDTLPLAAAGTIYYLSENPDQLAILRKDPTLTASAFEETTRYDQPTNILGRTLIKDVEWHGHTLKKDQVLLFLYASANRDEREFEQADKFRLGRSNRRSLSFGTGLHFCLGQHLARLEGRIILEEILSALPRFEVDKSQCARVYSEFVQGYCHVPLQFNPNDVRLP